MFGSGKKTAEFEQRIEEYRQAFLRVAQHVGVDIAGQASAERAAVAICDGIDRLAGKEPIDTKPGREERPIPASVRKIRLSGAVNITVRQGAEPRMEVFASSVSDLSKVLTTVSGDCLTVDNEPMMIITSGRGVSQIITGNVGSISMSGSIINAGCDIFRQGASVEQRDKLPKLSVEVTLPSVSSLRISGAGNVLYRDVQLDDLFLDVTGAGNIEVSGKTTRLEAEVSGAGDIRGFDLVAKHSRLRVSGAGNIKATATESVIARVSGVSKIKIAGNPSERDTDVSGMGKIRFVDYLASVSTN